MKFTLEIELGNDDMRSYEHIREVLAMVAKGRLYPQTGDRGTIHDVNGNKVGNWKVIPKPNNPFKA